MILDLGAIGPSPKLQKLLIKLDSHCKELGLELRVVGDATVAKLLKDLVETASIPVADSVDAAKAA